MYRSLIPVATLMAFYGYTQQSYEDEILKRKHEFFVNVNQDLEKITDKNQQISYLDSLKETLSTNYMRQRVNIFIANTYRTVELSKTFDMLNTVEQFIDTNPTFKHIKTHFNISKGRALYDSGKYNESLSYYLKAEKTAEEFKDPDNLWRYPIESKTGIISNYVFLNRNEEAMALLKTLEKQVSPNDKLDEYIYVLNLLGYLHTKSKNYKEGIRYFSEIINFLKDKEAYMESYLGAVNNLAYIYQLNDKKEEAIIIMEEALEQTRKYQVKNRELLLTNNLGFLYLEENDLDKAEALGLLSIKKSTLKFEEIKADAERLLASVYYKKELPKKALPYAESSASYFRKINDLNRLKNVLSIKNKILIREKRFEEATEVNAQMISLMDSISIKTDIQNLQKTLVEFETEKKDDQITILKQKEEITTVKLAQQRDQILFLIVSLIALAIIGLIIILFQRKLNTIKNLALRSKLTRSQFNPHYINNAFTTLQAELVEHHFNENLVNYTSSISRFSRLILESTFKDEWTLLEEKNMIENYLKVQQYRLNNNFDYIIESTINNKELNTLIMPSALTQTVLENAVEHGGFSNSNKRGTVQVTISKMDCQLLIKIKNSTLGTDPKENKKTNEPSRGLIITKQRVQLHGKIHKKNTSFDFRKYDQEVEVMFQLPILAA